MTGRGVAPLQFTAKQSQAAALARVVFAVRAGAQGQIAVVVYATDAMLPFSGSAPIAGHPTTGGRGRTAPARSGATTAGRHSTATRATAGHPGRPV